MGRTQETVPISLVDGIAWHTVLMAKSRGQPTAFRASRPGGRPTVEESAQLNEDVRLAALTLFLEHGYEGTSVDAIARAAGTTKASLYARFDTKESLFVSVVRWAIGRPDWPVDEPEPPDLDDFEGALRAIADAALRRALHPDMVSLTRIAVAQVGRFPGLARGAFAASWARKDLVVELLEHHVALGTIVADEPEILAEHFLGLVSGSPARLASFGIVRKAGLQRRYSEVAIQMFVRSLQPD
jgi:AcrR family transcriptional regulator